MISLPAAASVAKVSVVVSVVISVVVSVRRGEFAPIEGGGFAFSNGRIRLIVDFIGLQRFMAVIYGVVIGSDMLRFS